MTKEEAKKRIEKLRKVINHHRYLYHVLDTQEISDAALDSLKHELSQLEQHYPDLITPDSPTQRVGGEPLEKFKKVEHTAPMLSIGDIFTEEELLNWEEYLVRLSRSKPIEYFSEVKIDGFAVTLRYENGTLKSAATRGNGVVGEDVTQNVKTIESIPLTLELHSSVKNKRVERSLIENLSQVELEVRGEVYMEKEDFERFNEERKQRGEELFSNPRNLAAGSIRQLDPKLAAARPLQFMAYDLVNGFGQNLHSEEHEILKALGFKTDPTAKTCESIDEVARYWKYIGEKREKLLFHIDGVVVSVNENALHEKLGVAGKGYRGTRALKFAGKQATTKIIDVRFQVGRTGVVTPVAVLEPVQVGGVIVSRATLHNEDEIRRLGITIGDTVIVERAGDVIPSIIQALSDLRTGKEKAITMPVYCPVCGTALVRQGGEVAWRCPNVQCRAKKREFLYHFVSRKAFNIEGLGPKIIDKLVEEHLVSEPPDFFELEPGDLAPLERFAEKSEANIIAAIQQSKTISLSRFIYALGILQVGEETAKDLAKTFQTLEKLRTVSREELEAIRDIGPVVADHIVQWFQSKENQELIDDLLRVGVAVEKDKQLHSSQQTLAGKLFVFTGTLASLTREDAKKKVEELGGATTESVSKQTSYVVAGEQPGSKYEKAKKLGIPILTETDFLRLIHHT